MKKKAIIWTLVVLAVIVIAVILLVHYAPVWFSISSVVTLVIGFILGWIWKVVYDKYFKVK